MNFLETKTITGINVLTILFFRNSFRASCIYRVIESPPPHIFFFFPKPNSRNAQNSFLPLFFSYFFLSTFTSSAFLSYISATQSVPWKLRSLFLPDSVNLAMDSCKPKPGFSIRPARRARGDARRTLIIKDGWTSYHVQGKWNLTILTTLCNLFVYCLRVK